MLTLLTFSKMSTRKILIELLSRQDQYILSEKVKKLGRYGAQISETEVFVNHTFNVLEKFSMCQTLTSISAYYLTISAYIFLGDIYTMYMM